MCLPSLDGFERDTAITTHNKRLRDALITHALFQLACVNRINALRGKSNARTLICAWQDLIVRMRKVLM